MFLKKTDNLPTIIVSKDLNLRIKADALGLESQDYLTDKIDIKLLPDGYHTIENPEKEVEKKNEYDFSELGFKEEPFPNTYLNYGDLFLRYDSKSKKFQSILIDFESEIFGIKPRNVEQVFSWQQGYTVCKLKSCTISSWFQSLLYRWGRISDIYPEI